MLVELHAYSVDAVQIVEHIRSILMISAMRLVDSIVMRTTYSKWYLWSDGKGCKSEPNGAASSSVIVGNSAEFQISVSQ